MPTEVPYTGVPDTVQPQAPKFEPIPSLNVQAPPAAFGVNLAQAVEHLGDVQEGAAKELFGRALAFQQMDQVAAANAASAEYQNQSGERYAQYGEQKGKNAIDGWDQYVSDLDKLREDIRGTLTSPYAQQEYDQQTRNFRAYLVRSGAVHMRDEHTQFVTGSLSAATKSTQNAMELIPGDIEGNQQQIGKLKDLAGQWADVKGLPESNPERDRMISESVSTGVLGQARGLAEKGRVHEAKQIIDEQTQLGNVAPGPDRDRTIAFINEKKIGIGTRHEVAQALSGNDLSWGEAKLGDTDILNGLKGSEAGNYTFVGKDGWDSAHQNYGHPIGHFGVMSYNLQSFLKQAGMPSMSEQQYIADPDAQDKLALSMFKRYQDQFGSANKAALAWMGGPGSANADPATIHDVNMNGTTYLQHFNAGVARGSTLGARITNVTDRLSKLYANDTDLPDMLDRGKAQVEILYNQDQRIRNDGVFNNNETIWSAMINGIGPNKEIPATIDELKSDPKVAESWDWLAQNEPSKLKPVINEMVRMGGKDLAVTPERQNKFLNLIGTSQQDPEAFMEQTKDLGSLDLPFGMKKELLAKRGQIYRQSEADPKIGYALRLVGEQLRSVGLTNDGDKDGLMTFTGSLMDAMREWETQHDAPMSDDEIRAATSAIITKPDNQWTTFGPWAIHNTTPGMFQDPPETEAANIRASLPGRVLSDADIKRLYYAADALRAAEKYRSLYQKPPTAGRPPQ